MWAKMGRGRERIGADFLWLGCGLKLGRGRERIYADLGCAERKDPPVMAGLFYWGHWWLLRAIRLAIIQHGPSSY